MTADGPRQILEAWLPHRTTVVYLQDVYLTEAAFGPVSVIRLVGQGCQRGVDGAWGDDQFEGDLADLSARESADVDRDGLS